MVLTLLVENIVSSRMLYYPGIIWDCKCN